MVWWYNKRTNMSDYIAEKHFYLSRLFPQYASEMLFLMRAFDGFYQTDVQSVRDLQDYVINFAVYSNLEIVQNVFPDVDKRIKELMTQGRILTAGALEKRYNIKNAKFLLGEYDSALRLKKSTGNSVAYLTRDKEADFLFWVKNQINALSVQGGAEYKRCWKYRRATANMVLKPIIKKPTIRKSPSQPDVWAITDAQMHEVACTLARKRRIKDPDIALNDLVVSIVRRNMKEK